MSDQSKSRLLKIFKIFSLIGALLIAWVLLDFAFNFSRPDKQYRFKLPQLVTNQPVLLSKDKLLIIVARYDASTLSAMSQQGRLGRISESLNQQQPRVDNRGYFVVMAYGTDIGCPLEIDADGFSESCSDARYDRLVARWINNATRT